MLPGIALAAACFLFLLLTCLSYRTLSLTASSDLLETGKPVLLIDPGHGGEDGGTQSSSGLLEKDINLSISKKLQELLVLSGYRVKMTRETDCSIGDASLSTVRERKVSDLQRRFAIVSEEPNTVLVSIHQNYFTESKYHGTQVFYSGNSEESSALAEAIRLSVTSMLQPENKRENKPATETIYLLDQAQVPAVLVECGFLSNPEEAACLADETYQEQMAFCLCQGIVQFRADASLQA